MNVWSIHDLKIKLADRSEVRDWIISSESVERRERYFLAQDSAVEIDQDRKIATQNITLQLFVEIPTPGKVGKSTRALLLPLPLDEQIENAISSALKSSVQHWSLPATVPESLPELVTSDPEIAENIEITLDRLSDEIEAAAASDPLRSFCSAELAVSLHDRELYWSNGGTYRRKQSRIYAEVASSAADSSSEYLSTKWSVNVNELNIREIISESRDRAEFIASAVAPPAGDYSVVVDYRSLLMLFNSTMSGLTGAARYLGLPYKSPGDAYVDRTSGDPITLKLDPWLPCGADTVAMSDDGVPQLPLELVREDRVVGLIIAKEFSDYLGMPATTSRGVISVNAGSSNYTALISSEPVVLEVLEFSSLSVNSRDGTFNSEIRLARIHDNRNKKTFYVKGGSLSGCFFDSLKEIRLSDELVNFSHFFTGGERGHGYRGPEFALLKRVSVIS